MGSMTQETAWRTLVGHDWALDLLRGAILHNRVGHAYLFSGPEQIGKTTLARHFAMALNCQAPDRAARPCGECRPCRLIAEDRHPDVRLVEAEVSGRGKRTLKIEEIRHLQRDLNLAAYEARHKIAILPHFDAATPGAANAFLKTLEEPPRNVVLLLTAAEADALLPTISSRCRIVALRPLSVTEIWEALASRWRIQEDEARRLAHLADGRMGWAIQAAQDDELLQAREQHLSLLDEALPARRVGRFALADALAKDADVLPHILRTWLTWWRDLLLLSWGNGDGPLVNVDRRDSLVALSRSWEPQAILKALQKTKEAIWQLQHNANTRLVMENLLLVYPQMAMIVDEELIARQ